MTMVETYRLKHLPTPIYVALFKDVKNSSFLRTQLLAGNREFEYAFLDASVILSPNHLFAAVFRAVNNLETGRLKCRNVHSEIVFCLNPNNNESSTFLIALKVGSNDLISAASIHDHLSSTVQGCAVHFSSAAMTPMIDIGRIKSIYKFKSANCPSQAQDEEVKLLEAVILGTMALKGW